MLQHGHQPRTSTYNLFEELQQLLRPQLLSMTWRLPIRRGTKVYLHSNSSNPTSRRRRRRYSSSKTSSSDGSQRHIYRVNCRPCHELHCCPDRMR